MTQQEQFEKDYLEAFELCDNGTQFWWVSNAAQYYDEHHQIAFEVWLQQAKRHEAEIAELVAALKSLGASINGDYYRGQDWERACINDLIAKYEGDRK